MYPVLQVTTLSATFSTCFTAIAEATGTADTLKIAILAALNFADESRHPDRRDAARRFQTGDAEKRLDRLVTLLDDALAG